MLLRRKVVPTSNNSNDGSFPTTSKESSNDHGNNDTNDNKQAAPNQLKRMLAIAFCFTLYLVFFPEIIGKVAWTSLPKLPSSVDRFLNHVFYQVIDGLDTQGEVNCMNWGYKYSTADSTDKVNIELELELDPKDEPERYCMQMYHKLGTAAGDMAGKHVLEVGSGRGGGASYIKRYLHPESVTGLDYSSKAVEFSNQKHANAVPGLVYIQGDAEHLPFQDEEFDLVINVESSHCYEHFTLFLSEVKRDLKPGGHLSWVDFRDASAIPALNQAFIDAGFDVVKTEDVTANVVASMAASGEQKKKLIDRQVPKFARSIFYGFAGLEGTNLYKKLDNRKLIYTHKLARKKEL